SVRAESEDAIADHAGRELHPLPLGARLGQVGKLLLQLPEPRGVPLQALLVDANVPGVPIRPFGLRVGMPFERVGPGGETGDPLLTGAEVDHAEVDVGAEVEAGEHVPQVAVAPLRRSSSEELEHRLECADLAELHANSRGARYASRFQRGTRTSSV